jgi:hypothetical protein
MSRCRGSRAGGTLYLVSPVGPARAEKGVRNIVNHVHREATEQHELAAHAHRTAAEHSEKGDHSTAFWHSERALEYSDRAYKLAKEAHNKSGQIVNI